MNTGRAVIGIGFVALGTLLLLDRAGVLDAGGVIADWWPAVFLVAAALELIARPRRPIGATVFAVIGVLLLGGTTGLLTTSVWAIVWPVGFIALGLWLLLRRTPTGRGWPDGSADDVVDATVLFSGRRIVSTAHAFRGGSATAVFGGIEIDLTGAEIEGTAELEAVALFGGVDIQVPAGWRVLVDGPAIFGGHENNVPAPGDPDAPVLRVAATAIFGGIEVKIGSVDRVVATA